MNYINELAQAIGRECDMDVGHPPDRQLLSYYALLALVTGVETTSENVHDAWSAWRVEEFCNHRSAIPFNELSAEVQALDDEYRDAIIKVAKVDADGR